MSEHRASVRWKRASADFTYDHYNRAHEVSFKSGAVALPGSAAPAFRGDADRVDPEEAYVASLSACHMLSFLAICARKRLTVDSYEDDAVGVMEKKRDRKTVGCPRHITSTDKFRAWNFGKCRATGGDSPPKPRGMLHRQFGEDRRVGCATVLIGR